MATLISPTFLKQKAKKLRKSLGMSHHEALDEASKKYGFSNYRHYLNVLKESESATEEKISSEDDKLKVIQFETPFEQSAQMTFHEQLNFLKVFQHSDDIQAQCEKWNLMKEEIQSALFNEFLTEQGQYEIDFRHKYFVAKEISVSDLKYELKGDMLCVDGDYDLKIKLEEFCIVDGERVEIEYDASDRCKEYSPFDDRVLSGPFGIKIDKNKKITIHHLSIIEMIDGLVYAGTLKPTARLMPAFRPEIVSVSI